ncbi:MAG: hypothetical protein GTO22_21360, partial [Gemmatimonadales bacterium]|nr:hypothetical protein [Gemmatimonadales bacterium]
GLMYMRNRYYDPQSGQFTQEDPIGLAGGLNLYGFADGDPVNFSDPFGLCRHGNGEELPPDQCRDANAHEGHRVFRGAVQQGQWQWTMGDEVKGQVAKDQDNKVGDCTDFVEASMRAAGFAALDWTERPATFEFGGAGATAVGTSNYRALNTGEGVQQGDVVIYKGHAGIASGRTDASGRFKVWQNGTSGTGWMWMNANATVYRRQVPITP